jgi:death on curing protein
MSDWNWLRPDALKAQHSEQLAEHGGSSGIRDEGLFESAMARPENLNAYGEPSVFELAAAYASGIVRNHPFVDGNKRTGFLAGIMFLELNGQAFSGPDIEVVEKTLALAAREMSDDEYAQWLKDNSKKK